jgi:signal transduction histidine kinase
MVMEIIILNTMISAKRSLLLLISIWCSLQLSFGQQQKIADSLAKIYQSGSYSDGETLPLLEALSFNEITDLGKGLRYADKLIELSKKSGNKNYQRIGYFLKGNKLRLQGELDKALDAYFKCTELSKELKNAGGEGECYGAIGDIYSMANNFDNAYTYYQKAIRILTNQKAKQVSLAAVISNAGDLFLKNSKYDSALLYFNNAKSVFEKAGNKTGIGYCLGNIGMVYANIGNTTLAQNNMNKAIEMLEEAQDYYPICVYLISIADIFEKNGERTEALNYLRRSLQLAQQTGLKEQIAEASLKLSNWYEKEGNEAEAYQYYKMHITYRDSVNNLMAYQKMFNLRIDFEQAQSQSEVSLLKQQKRNQRNLLILLGIILLLAISILFIVFRSNSHKRKSFEILKKQKQEIDLQRAKAEDALNTLKQTQKQLIQSAKMASLGELTAGIAHEMKNPLNFINNFSEVTIELLDELKEKVITKLPGEDKEDAENIVSDIESNLNKILQHGKRADSIVQGMLQHSGQTSGRKELVDINMLADECIRLSYHGLNAREKSVISRVHTVFDQSVGMFEAVPQDIGRVLLNLFQNAYYAVIKKKDMLLEPYEPEVKVSTKRAGQNIEIRVRDNGTGVSANLLDKIFQPFFTTKPTGQGTGLGLSLCHDIIEAHGGTISVDSTEGQYTEFIIVLPAPIESD